MHVVTTSLYTLIHASLTRGEAAIEEMGVLPGYRGVIVHDRLAMYWKLKRAKHAICGAHLFRDLADVAVVSTQTAWAAEIATLLVEINNASHEARRSGRRQVELSTRRSSRTLRRACREGMASTPSRGAASAIHRAKVVQPRDGVKDPQESDALRRRPPHTLHQIIPTSQLCRCCVKGLVRAGICSGSSA